MKRILDPTFRYVPSFETDVRKTFERARRELSEPAPLRPADPRILRLAPQKRSGRPA